MRKRLLMLLISIGLAVLCQSQEQYSGPLGYIEQDADFSGGCQFPRQGYAKTTKTIWICTFSSITAGKPQYLWTKVGASGLGSGSAGQVTFWSGTGVQSGDNALWWNNTTKRFGVGTNTPTSLIHVVTGGVATSNVNSILVTSTGGLGVNAAQFTARGEAGGYGAGIRFESTESGTNTVISQAAIESEGSLQWNAVATASSFLRFSTADAGTLAERVRILSAGNVGIGVTAPAEKLEVNGGVRLNTATAQPSCDATARGTFWVIQGAAGVKDDVQVCTKDAANDYAWRVIY